MNRNPLVYKKKGASQIGSSVLIKHHAHRTSTAKFLRSHNDTRYQHCRNVIDTNGRSWSCLEQDRSPLLRNVDCPRKRDSTGRRLGPRLCNCLLNDFVESTLRAGSFCRNHHFAIPSIRASFNCRAETGGHLPIVCMTFDIFSPSRVIYQRAIIGNN